MNRIKTVVSVAVAAVCMAASAPKLTSQVSINIGVAPQCPYGYYDYTPYGCAPYGYYGPEWFHGGRFVGVGPWFHGSANFHGHVNNNFDPQHGYTGHMPGAGEKAANRSRAPKGFAGNEVRDGRGHAGAESHGNTKH